MWVALAVVHLQHVEMTLARILVGLGLHCGLSLPYRFYAPQPGPILAF